MDNVKITEMKKVGSKWVVVSEKSKPATVKYYNNILNDKNVFGDGTRVTNNYCQFGKMDSKTFYGPDKKLKSVYSFK